MYRPIDIESASRSVYLPNYNAFEIFGLDFMIDSNLQISLIEVNTNPCLE